MKKITILAVLIIGSAVFASASVSVAPEIDPASGASAVALLAGVALVYRGRRK